MYLHVKWNSFCVICSPAVQLLKHVILSPGHARNGDLRRRRRRV